MSLLFELVIGYLVLSAVVTVGLLRFFQRTQERAASAVVVEFAPRAISITQPLEGEYSDRGERAA